MDGSQPFPALVIYATTPAAQRGQAESFLAFRQTDFGRAATQVIGELHPQPCRLTQLAAIDPPS